MNDIKPFRITIVFHRGYNFWALKDGNPIIPACPRADENCINALTVNYEITRKLNSLLGCQTTSLLVIAKMEKLIKINLSLFGQFSENCYGNQLVKYTEIKLKKQ